MFRSAATDDVRIVRGSADNVAGVPSQIVGNVETAVGWAMALRAGVAVQLNEGAVVCPGDVIETGADSAVRVALNDGTLLELSANARLVLNELVCEPNGTANSALLSLARGAFAFIAGKLATAGKLRIETPLTSIRARAGGSGIGILSLAAVAFAETNEAQAAGVPQSDDDAITFQHLDHGVFDIIGRNGVVIRQAIDPGKTYVVDDAGNVTEIQNSDSRMVDLYNQQFAARGIQTKGMAGDPTGTGTPGSSFSTPDTPQLQPINFIQPGNVGGQDVPTLTLLTSSGALPAPPPPETPPPPPPTIAINSITAANIGVAGGNIINASASTSGFDISGTESGVDGRTVTITIVDSNGQVVGTYSTTAGSGAWQVNLTAAEATALADGSYTVIATTTNSAGVQAQASTSITVDEHA